MLSEMGLRDSRKTDPYFKWNGGHGGLLQFAFSPCVLSGVSQNWMVQKVLSETYRISFSSIGGACQV